MGSTNTLILINKLKSEDPTRGQSSQLGCHMSKVGLSGSCSTLEGRWWVVAPAYGGREKRQRTTNRLFVGFLFLKYEPASSKIGGRIMDIRKTNLCRSNESADISGSHLPRVCFPILTIVSRHCKLRLAKCVQFDLRVKVLDVQADEWQRMDTRVDVRVDMQLANSSYKIQLAQI